MSIGIRYIIGVVMVTVIVFKLIIEDGHSGFPVHADVSSILVMLNCRHRVLDLDADDPRLNREVSKLIDNIFSKYF